MCLPIDPEIMCVWLFSSGLAVEVDECDSPVCFRIFQAARRIKIQPLVKPPGLDMCFGDVDRVDLVHDVGSRWS